MTEADLPGLQEAVTKLQKEYDDAVVVKNNLGNDVRSCSERLKAATGLLHRYISAENNRYKCYFFFGRNRTSSPTIQSN